MAEREGEGRGGGGALETRAPREWKWRKGRGLGRRERGFREKDGEASTGQKRDSGVRLLSYLKARCRAPCHQEGVVSGSCCLQLALPLPGGFQTNLCPRNSPVWGLPGTATPRISELRGGAVKRVGGSGQDKRSDRRGSSCVKVGGTSLKFES